MTHMFTIDCDITWFFPFSYCILERYIFTACVDHNNKVLKTHSKKNHCILLLTLLIWLNLIVFLIRDYVIFRPTWNSFIFEYLAYFSEYILSRLLNSAMVLFSALPVRVWSSHGWPKQYQCSYWGELDLVRCRLTSSILQHRS